jgi:hypothetical protein
MDDFILKKVKSITSNSSLYINANLMKQETNFMLWLGVTTGKRAWIEETDAYIALIDLLIQKYKHIGVVIDGWTASHTTNIKQNQSNKFYSQDEVIKDKIIEKFKGNSNVTFISVIGAMVEEKIAIADLTDFFIANHATGSLWISRIAKKRGITHISNAARESAKKLHIQWDVHLIPEKFTHDIKENVETPFHISYNINIDIFLERVLLKLNSSREDFIKLEEIDEKERLEIISNNKTIHVEQAKKEYNLLKNFNIYWKNYHKNNKIEDLSSDPISHYINNWRKKNLIIDNIFNTYYYLEKYPDIKKANVNPLIHYFRNGIKEGRKGVEDKK